MTNGEANLMKGNKLYILCICFTFIFSIQSVYARQCKETFSSILNFFKIETGVKVNRHSGRLGRSIYLASKEGLQAIPSNQIKLLNNKQLFELTPRLHELTPEQIRALTPYQLKRLHVYDKKRMSTTWMDFLDPEQVKFLSLEKLDNIANFPVSPGSTFKSETNQKISFSPYT